MKKKIVAVAMLGLSLPVIVHALEFQTPGALGMGRAGVARTTDAYAMFFNPAGLAFYEKTFSMRLGTIAGVAVSSTLADNIDKAGKMDLDVNNMTYTGASSQAQAAAATTKAAQFAGLLVDINDKKGEFAVNADVALGFQFRNYGLGVYGVSEVGAGVGTVDLVNIRAGNETSTTSVSTLYTNIGASTLDSNVGTAQFFSQTDYNKIVADLVTAGAASVAQAQAIVTKLETELKANGNSTGMTADQISKGLQVLVPALNTTPANSIDNNTTTVLLRGITIAEVPIAYGHKFDLGSFGKLGIGGAAKIMQGTVYSTDIEVMKMKKSEDVTDKAKESKTDSTQFGLDLGAMWKLEPVPYIGPVNFGLSLKNLNSPEFDGPLDKNTGKMTSKVKVEPQARVGVALDPFSWLSIVADVDVTKNKTIVQGRESQLFGGGIEARFDYWYTLWLALRAGAYTNIAQTGSKPVVTAGLSLGPQYFRLDINAAMATANGIYDNKSVPLEAKVEFGLSTTF